MTPTSAIMNSVETLDYRVTVGDVATKAGLEINLARQQLLALAADTGGNLQVTETGEIVYLFPRNFRGILRNKHWQLQWQQSWQKVWRVLFYLIRISFGIALILSVLLMFVAIAVIVIGLSVSGNNEENSDRRDNSGGGVLFLPRFWFSPDFFGVFSWNRGYSPQSNPEKKINFLESIFSFLFGDGNPNSRLEEHRWQEIGTVIRNQKGAIVAQQIAPYLDNIADFEEEDYILPVLARFNGYPQVSDTGEIIYYFPDLQVTATEKQAESVSPYLKEKTWQFSQAGSGQIIGAIALGCLNFILALVLGYLLQGDLATQLGEFVTFVASIYWVLWGYGVSFLTIPLVRYFWLQGRNNKIRQRNQNRETVATMLSQASDSLGQKIAYARRFAAQKVIGDEDITYSTEQDLLDQNLQRADQIDQDWLNRLESQ
ncbi:hypothetical protein [Gloeocapsa sp. PCC 73106]|uniref:hypothetical protein n=1 Tax=Gloeocapsa sp. PCC 73106 TaxID=102232 RepID=UPI0002ABCCF1|nr:hypothetical protein [Gloeocapsa sp. PCC 73106]ELR99015.1 hypothetical protein GLO73106DRAFT_00028590 [Gloeocapsa sp. PCC 73106]